ncbi:MAG: phosphate ABC transporter substrate-binding protein PstS [Ignisphaera sp.]
MVTLSRTVIAIAVAVIVTAIAVYSLTHIMLASDRKEQYVTVTRTVQQTIHQTVTVLQTTTITTPVTVTVTQASPTITHTVTLYTPRPEVRGLSVSGAGASFQYPQIAQWARLFKEVAGVEVTYQSVGSGAGQKMFLVDRVTDFAASDPPLTKSQYEQYRGQVMQIPWIMGAVVVVYNVPEIKGHNLKLTGEVIAKIYRGEIEYWDDPAIKELNPDIANILPRKQIIAVHRSDSSGTTEIFTIFLNKAAPNIWDKDLVGKVVNWPVDATGRGIGAKGNEGVTATVLQTPYSIGYVELSYALENNLPIAAIRNAAGRFVLPTDETIRNAAKGISIPSSPLDDFSEMFVEVIYSQHEDSYPISSLAFLFVWREYGDRNKALALSEFLKWIAIEGYSNMVRGYVAPPQQIIELLLSAARLLES